MLIMNADDWGRSAEETDTALACYASGRITSVTAMMFMPDAERAAELAREYGLEVGLHLNLSQTFGDARVPCEVATRQARVCHFINAGRYALLVYNPARRHDFIDTFRAQYDEFLRLYGRPPTHVDGHHHKHLCSNVLLDDVIPADHKVRRSLFFWPGEKSVLNRACRGITDRVLARRYRVTDYFFALSQCLRGDRLGRVLSLAASHSVELMTHPVNDCERAMLLSEDFQQQLAPLQRGSYACL